MRIFFSHSGRQKPLMREIRKQLPDQLDVWIDEERLLFGDNIRQSLEATIKTDADYVILFLDDYAIKSPWVQDEVRWASEAEIVHGRTILLIVVIDAKAFDDLADASLRRRKYLQLRDHDERSVRALSEAIEAEIFALVCRELDQLRNPQQKVPFDALADANAHLRSQAALIQKIVFPHRKATPIAFAKLLEIMNAHGNHEVSRDEFERLFHTIAQQALVPGLSYDGNEVFLVEEHAGWKLNIEHAKKEAIGRKAAAEVTNGQRVFIDAGSTAAELVKILCKRIETRMITRIAVGTTSVQIAERISDCCVRMGFDDEFSAVQLYVPGGRIRPNTQAIVPAFGSDLRQIRMMAELLGGFDLCFVGVNGITTDGALMTHTNMEAQNKMDILKAATARRVIGDSSKLGLSLEAEFSRLGEDGPRLIIDNETSNRNLAELVERYRDMVILA